MSGCQLYENGSNVLLDTCVMSSLESMNQMRRVIVVIDGLLLTQSTWKRKRQVFVEMLGRSLNAARFVDFNGEDARTPEWKGVENFLQQ